MTQAIKIIDASAPEGIWLEGEEAGLHISQFVLYANDFTVTPIGRQMGRSWFHITGPRGMDQAIGITSGTPEADALLALTNEGH